MEEIWKTVVGARYYEVSNLGRIRSLDRVVPGGAKKVPTARRGRILTPTSVKSNSGRYVRYSVTLGSDTGFRNAQVHRLILEAFVGPCPPGMEACHGNGNSLDNRLENLRWDTRRANVADSMLHGTFAAKRTANQFRNDVHHYMKRVTELENRVLALERKLNNLNEQYSANTGQP